MKAWWKEAVVYQIYPRSFCDSNGDGVGDLPGVIQKLDYIRRLGADVIWLCPVYRSPNDDNGYDISDYRSVMEEFGTLEDLERLLAEAHKRGLKIVMDLVVNHTSDEHAWFLESRKSRENPRRDYYIWKDGKNGGPPNNWGSNFSGSAWKYDETSGQYYLHLYSEKQPDLNWENPKVRGEIWDMMRWWLEKGVDGFRMDVINQISKVPGMPDGETGGAPYANPEPYTCNGPRVHEYLQEMNREVLSHYDIMTVGETPSVTVEEAKKYAGFGTDELNMVFQFEHTRLDYGKYGKWAVRRTPLCDLKTVLSRWQTELDGCAWNSLYWNNHDQPRAVSRFGDDSTPEYRVKSAKMLGTCLHMMQGTPYIYQGEELGMTNVAFDSIEDYRDIQTLNAYREFLEERGVSREEMMSYLHARSRDNARTPMQWNASRNAGFTVGEPWIKVNPNYRQINAESQVGDPDSVFSYYRRLIRLRREYGIIVYGSYRLLDIGGDQAYCYTRNDKEQVLLALCNFSREQVALELPEELHGLSGELLISNCEAPGLEKKLVLDAYDARVYLLTK